jgi:hypothetical protein
MGDVGETETERILPGGMSHKPAGQVANNGDSEGKNIPLLLIISHGWQLLMCCV